MVYCLLYYVSLAVQFKINSFDTWNAKHVYQQTHYSDSHQTRPSIRLYKFKASNSQCSSTPPLCRSNNARSTGCVFWDTRIAAWELDNWSVGDGSFVLTSIASSFNWVSPRFSFKRERLFCIVVLVEWITRINKVTKITSMIIPKVIIIPFFRPNTIKRLVKQIAKTEAMPSITFRRRSSWNQCNKSRRRRRTPSPAD